MELAAIYNVWSDSSDLLKGSIDRIKKHVDFIVIVYQTTSNFGEFDNGCIDDLMQIWGKQIHKVPFEPMLSEGGMTNETNKRNIGINHAKALGATHFLLMDCDEYYDTEGFANAKEWFINSKLNSSYCDLFTFMYSHDLRLEHKEAYFVPFICDIKTAPVGGFLFDRIVCDPTRKPKGAKSPQKAPITMQHLSWVRKDILKKVRNSSARDNIHKVIEDVKWDIDNAAKEKYSRYYHQALISHLG